MVRRNQRTQRGTGVIVVLLLLVIVGIVGFTGWYVIHSQKANDATLTQTDKASDSNKANKATVTPIAPTGNTVELLKYSTVPKELQMAILQYTKSSAPGCVVNDVIVDMDKKPVDQDVSYAASGSAITGIGCDGSSAALFVKRPAGQWEMIEKTQLGFYCPTLKANHVPARLLVIKDAAADPNVKAKCTTDTDLVDYVE